MKKYLFILLVLGCISIGISQEAKFSFQAGYVSGAGKIKFDGIVLVDDVDTSFADGENVTIKESEGGFYAGISAEIPFSDKVYLTPQLLYTNLDDQSLLQIPVFVKFKLDTKFSIIAGPQLTYTLEKTIDEVRKVNIGVGAGASFDISEKVFVEAKYTLQLNDYYKTNQIDSKLNFLNIGLGYRF
ncbi:outer membrane beta-barrel protein [Lutibacter sp. TH_r2]|uniref:outer membrane beta-barrel protein n=1 Tax=Lutibacter sp. TH_r2 TaxID=3082083 RepID=UPI002954207C|nr:outer membrane beta-barrel protein [Lutibacter sp. TH_r2]MDV7187481.1 outer membrane beta-barrel protein [Lutibacter sp. TH_r2]